MKLIPTLFNETPFLWVVFSIFDFTEKKSQSRKLKESRVSTFLFSQQTF